MHTRDLQPVGREVWSGGSFVDKAFAQRYVFSDGLALFQNDDLDSAERVDQLDQMVANTRRMSWRDAVEKTYGVDSGMIRYITDQSRHGYLDLIPTGADSRVLEIGRALGQCTTLIAGRCGELVAMDVVRGQAEFTKLRCEQSEMKNVHVAVGGEDGRLPFRSGSFDVVILNLVLEWCGSRSQEDHEVVQRRLLSEIARVMKDGGCAWIATKNRYALRLLLGGRDEHCAGLRFGSALPRSLCRLLMRIRGAANARGHLHSHRYLKRMVMDSGFRDCEPAVGLPEGRYAEVFVMADSDGFRELRRDGVVKFASGRWQSKIVSLVPNSLYKYLAWGNAFVATK